MWALGHFDPDPLLATYSDAPIRRGEILAWLIVSTIILLALLGIGIYQLYDGYTHYGPVAAQAWAAPWLGASATAVLTLSVLALCRFLISRRTLEVRKNGLRAQPALGPMHYYPWEQVTGVVFASTQSVAFGAALFTSHQARILIRDAPAISVGDVSGKLLEAVTLLKASLYPRLLPVLRANFRDRKPVPFGQLVLHKDTGIEIRRGWIAALFDRLFRREAHLYPWNQIRRVTVQAGYLMVESKRDARILLPVGQVPNLEILLQLLREEAKL